MVSILHALAPTAHVCADDDECAPRLHQSPYSYTAPSLPPSLPPLPSPPPPVHCRFAQHFFNASMHVPHPSLSLCHNNQTQNPKSTKHTLTHTLTTTTYLFPSPSPPPTSSTRPRFPSYTIPALRCVPSFHFSLSLSLSLVLSLQHQSSSWEWTWTAGLKR